MFSEIKTISTVNLIQKSFTVLLPLTPLGVTLYSMGIVWPHLLIYMTCIYHLPFIMS
jgi:hypothetical protein